MRQRGFTVIELLIATLIFSIMVIIITTAIISFSRQFYRGVIQSSTQSTARTIIDDITRSIQFNPGQIYELQLGGNVRGYCVGDAKRYSFALDRQVIDDSPSASKHQSYHGLVSDTRPSCSTAAAPLDVTSLGASLSTTNARELLGDHMRLAKLSIVNSGEFYTVTVKVVYGDDDLLTSPTNPNMSCANSSASQFCAVSELTTTVKKRVN